jgi:hypothetical protein
MEESTPELAALIGKRFLQRRDVKAIQIPTGEYVPDHTSWKMRHLIDHIEGKHSYGHYLLDTDSKTRVFAFDIDLEKTGAWPKGYDDQDESRVIESVSFNPREAWRDRNHPARNWMKYQLRMVAQKFASTAHERLGLPVAVAYSGSKGVHVYCFLDGPTEAKLAREAATLVIDWIGELEPKRGNSFFAFRDKDAWNGYPNLSIEVYPKQDTVTSGKGYSNLMRLPLGRNLKSTDPTFFLDLKAPMGQFLPDGNPIQLLETGDPWRE